MKDIYPTPPRNPARTITLNVQVHLPEGCRLANPLRHGESETATLSAWMTEHLRCTYLPSITSGAVPVVLAMPVPPVLARREGGAE